MAQGDEILDHLHKIREADHRRMAHLSPEEYARELEARASVLVESLGLPVAPLPPVWPGPRSGRTPRGKAPHSLSSPHPRRKVG